MTSVLIDTSLLVLLVVGRTGEEIIGKHKRTKTFSKEDYELLLELIGNFNERIVTSHCFAEASNLLKQTQYKEARRLLSTLSLFVGRFVETHVSKENIVKEKHFIRLGVADSGIIHESESVTLSLTTDLDLYIAISDMGRSVENFNHLRI